MAAENGREPITHRTDEAWEQWGAKDPYYGVLTDPRFRAQALSPQAREEFFMSGRMHVEHVLSLCRRHVDPAFAPARVLDFGCGVGRLAIPFSEHAAEVVGVDVSLSMLAEAERNRERCDIHNLTLRQCTDTLDEAEGVFDLVHSFIVLQHVEAARGMKLIERLAAKIAPGGIGALHVTFAWDAFAGSYGRPPPPAPAPSAAPRPRWRRGPLTWMTGRKRDAEPSPPPEPPRDPAMHMDFYDLGAVLFILQRHGTRHVHMELTDHGGVWGALLLFAAAAPAVDAAATP